MSPGLRTGSAATGAERGCAVCAAPAAVLPGPRACCFRKVGFLWSVLPWFPPWRLPSLDRPAARDAPSSPRTRAESASCGWGRRKALDQNVDRPVESRREQPLATLRVWSSSRRTAGRIGTPRQRSGAWRRQQHRGVRYSILLRTSANLPERTLETMTLRGMVELRKPTRGAATRAPTTRSALRSAPGLPTRHGFVRSRAFHVGRLDLT